MYENEVLQMMGQEEGRIRPVRDAGGNVVSYAYDYMIKDHLGNVRAVLTDEQQQDNYPVATLESAAITNEQTYYDNLNIGITTPAPAAFGGSGNTVQALIKNAATTPVIGAAKLLKVMATDKLTASVDYYYAAQSMDNGNANGLNTILSMLTGLLNGSTAPAALHGSGAAISAQLGNNSNFTTLFLPQASSGSTVPKAYLNILFFDEQFRFVPGGSQCIAVVTAGSVQTLGVANVAVPKNGYAYVYISNESNNVVYFDNLHVLHNRGPLLEETHYYPFGLTMAGISSKAAGKTENKLKYNGKEEQSKEFSDGSGLDWLDYGARMYDAQVGRWFNTDALSEKYYSQSTYNYSLNNPVMFNDPDGRDVDPSRLKGMNVVALKNLLSTKDGYKLVGQFMHKGQSLKITLSGKSTIFTFNKEGARAKDNLVLVSTPNDKLNPKSEGAAGIHRDGVTSETERDNNDKEIGDNGKYDIKKGVTFNVFIEKELSEEESTSALTHELTVHVDPNVQKGSKNRATSC